ncbi:hypothetical protein CVT26_004867, partial [Gymnopilus dilepis]
MDAEGGFKVPHTIPQDLLLIQELIGAAVPVPVSVSGNAVKVDLKVGGEKKGVGKDEEDISSSSEEDSSGDEEDAEDEAASEEEIAAELVSGVTDEDDMGAQNEQKDIAAPSESTSDSDSESDSSSSSEEEDQKTGASGAPQKLPAADADEPLEALDDEDDTGPTPTSGTYFQTKHEVQ